MSLSTRRPLGIAVAAGLSALLAVGAVAVAAPSGAMPPPGPLCPRSTEIFVTDNSAFGPTNGGVIAVDAATGTRSPLSENGAPVGLPEFETPWGMTVDANGDLLVAEQWFVGLVRVPAVIRVDRVSGVRTLVSSNVATAAGPQLGAPTGIAVEASGSIVVADLTAFGGSGGIIRVDPVTGTRQKVSRNGGPAGGPSFNMPMDLAVAANGDIYVLNTAAGEVIRVNPVTGARTLVSRNGGPGGGPQFVWPWGLALAANGDLLVSDANAFGGGAVVGPGGIIRVNPVTGNRSVFSNNNNPAGGPLFDHPGDLVVESCGDVLVTDSGTLSVYRVDAATGARTIVSDNASPGTPAYAWPHGIVARS